MPAAARADDCGPDKLGTSRIVAVGTEGGLAVGFKTYPKEIPLADHEVILTFDDGPEPATTPQVLAALAAQCVRATFFDDRSQGRGRSGARAPRGRRGPYESPITRSHIRSRHCAYMGAREARADILRGMITVEKIVYGADFSASDPKDLADLKLHTPFFRFPDSPTRRI